MEIKEWIEDLSVNEGIGQFPGGLDPLLPSKPSIQR